MEQDTNKETELNRTEKKIISNEITNVNDSLIPIKGIDAKRKSYLNQLGIFTASDLLQQGRTSDQRKLIANKLMNLEMGNLKDKALIEKWQGIFIKYVNSWIKQADLWRVKGMDEDTAYFLVELGIRHVEDLSKVDPEKAYPIMECLKNSQPDFTLITLAKLKTLINNAKNIPTRYLDYQNRLSAKLENSLKILEKSSVKSKEIRKLLSRINIEDIIGGNSFEIDDPAPTFLFRDNINNKFVCDSVDSSKVIVKGLGFLKDVELTLPLPKILRGTIYMIKTGETLPDDINKRHNYALYNALVEISGISSPSEDKTENNCNPQGYTDNNGNFIIIMPDKYNMQEAITISISQGINKQKFILSASNIINHVDKQKVLKAFNELDLIYADIETEEEKLNFINDIENRKASPQFTITEEEQERFNRLFPEKDLIISELSLLQDNKAKLESIIRNSDSTTNDLERILRNLLYCDNLVSDFREEPFVLNEDVFKNYPIDKKKVLPSVKLMENEKEAIYLPTDTAPSRIFSYSMLQRLVEPAISPLADMQNLTPRISMKDRVDVMDFKEKISTSPESWPQMSSLGIGYVLNMHQAWIPDGFSLGSLLYSLVLAPGEEQRLIVREKTQSYSITDNAQGTDSTSEVYNTSQTDNTTAAYEYALNQLLDANSSYNYSTKTSTFGGSGGLGGMFSGFSAMLGLSGSTAKSSGKASSSASQSNSHNEVSNAAQNFQHGIKSASEKISQAQRLSISMATSKENDSVATRIIANHNHSHAMTIQYWEVMRRYRLETCVDSVDLVLFVPLKLINFLNGQKYILDSKEMNRTLFNTRYEILLKYADALEPSLPNKYQTGLDLIRQYAACPNWIMENTDISARFINLEFKGTFLSFDDITATMILKDGKGRIAGSIQYNTPRYELEKDTYETSNDLKEQIKKLRNKTEDLITCTCTFAIPANITDDDLSHIQIDYSCDEFKYVLYKNPVALSASNENASELYQYMIDKTWDLVKDRDDSAADRRKIQYCKEMLPEAWLFPNVTISPNELKKLGTPTISDVNLYTSRSLSISQGNDGNANTNTLTGMLSSSILSSSISIIISSSIRTLKYSQLQQIESTLHHIASNTTKYSQVFWATLSADERALLLEQYTIDMDFSKITEDTNTRKEFKIYNPNITNNLNITTNTNTNNEPLDIPLLNCINVKKLLGFYGNCMLFPFTYPEELANKIGKTAGELQDSLYRYHTNYFRVPSTTISLPTDGMIGEAVLGETNVSEEIDLTRFWNWKDSPIDSMSIDNSYLNNNDYLSGKTTKDISALNIQGATATTPVTAADLVTALVNKQTPTFDNITGLDQLKDILNTATNSTATGRDTALTTSSEMAKTAMEYAYKAKELDMQTELATLKEKLAKAEEELSKAKNTNQNNGNDSSPEKDTNHNNQDHTGSNDISNNKSNMDLESFKKILEEALKSKNEGMNPLDFFNSFTNSQMTEEEILAIAKDYCSKNGISFNKDI